MFENLSVELPGSLSGLFKKKKKKGVGVDIGSSNIKIVEIEKKNNELLLKNYAFTKVNKEGIVKSGASKVISGEVGVIVRKIFDDIGIKSNDINVSVPSFASLVTTIDLPPVSEREVDQIIQVEAPKYIPIPLSEVVYGWESVDMSDEDDNKENLALSRASKRNPVRVILASVMKNVSQEYEKIFNENGFNIESLEIDTFALRRSLANDNKNNYVIVDAGSFFTNISVVFKGKIVINRSINVGSEKMTELLSRSMGLNQERVAKIRDTQGLDVESQDIKNQVMIPLLKTIADDVKNAIGGFQEYYSDFSLKEIILTGGFSRMKGFQEFLSKETKLNVSMGNPWSGIVYPKEIEQSLNSISPYFGTATGLALRGLIEE